MLFVSEFNGADQQGTRNGKPCRPALLRQVFALMQLCLGPLRAAWHKHLQFHHMYAPLCTYAPLRANVLTRRQTGDYQCLDDVCTPIVPEPSEYVDHKKDQVTCGDQPNACSECAVQLKHRCLWLAKSCLGSRHSMCLTSSTPVQHSVCFPLITLLCCS